MPSSSLSMTTFFRVFLHGGKTAMCYKPVSFSPVMDVYRAEERKLQLTFRLDPFFITHNFEIFPKIFNFVFENKFLAGLKVIMSGMSILDFELDGQVEHIRDCKEKNWTCLATK